MYVAIYRHLWDKCPRMTSRGRPLYSFPTPRVISRNGRKCRATRDVRHAVPRHLLREFAAVCARKCRGRFRSSRPQRRNNSDPTNGIPRTARIFPRPPSYVRLLVSLSRFSSSRLFSSEFSSGSSGFASIQHSFISFMTDAGDQAIRALRGLFKGLPRSFLRPLLHPSASLDAVTFLSDIFSLVLAACVRARPNRVGCTPGCNRRCLFPVNVIESSTCLSPSRRLPTRRAAAHSLSSSLIVAHAEHFLQLETAF